MLLVFCLVLVFHSGFELWWFEFAVGAMVLRVVLLQFRVGIWADYCWLVSDCFAWCGYGTWFGWLRVV